MTTPHGSTHDVILTFGKHRGKTLAELFFADKGYLKWGSEQLGFPTDWKLAFARTLAGEPVYDLSLPRKSKGTAMPVVSHDPNAPSSGLITLRAVGDHIVEVRFPYKKSNPQDVIRKDGFKNAVESAKWNTKDFRWEISSIHVDRAVEFFGGPAKCDADEQCKIWYQEEVTRRKALDMIRVMDDSVEIRDKLAPKLKTPLFPFQNTGVHFVDRAEGRAMIADDMGLGKTAQAIGYIVLHKLRTLVVCPKAVKVGWVRELRRFAGIEAAVWQGTECIGDIDSQVHIINYDILANNLETIMAMNFDSVVADEATYLKNPKTKRAKAFFTLKTKYAILLTGTPVMNRPVEAFPLLHYLAPARFASMWKFTQKYGGFRGEPSRNLDDLHERTKDLVIRRRKVEILTELPPKQRNDLFVEMDGPEEIAYNKLLKDMFKGWSTNRKPSVADIPKIQRFLFEIKKQRITEMVDELLEEGRSVILFSVYRAQMEWFKQHYGDVAAHVDGSMSEKQRQASIDSLKAGKAKVGCFTLGAGGMGIDGLQHSIDTAIFLDQWFVPAWHDQAEDRIFRIGQTRQVSIFYAIVAGTIDEIMRGILVEKQHDIDAVVDGRQVTAPREKSFFKEFVKRLKKGFQKDMGSVDIVEDDDIAETLPPEE